LKIKEEVRRMRKSIVLVGILALGLILLAGCRQRPKKVELEKKEPGEAIYEETVLLEEPEIVEAPPVAQAPPVQEPTPVEDPVEGKINPAPQRGARVNINTASAKELEKIPGVGPAKAQAIIAGRLYATIEDLDRVPGIGIKTIERLKPYITCE
jgi:competence protein ComEA